MHRTYVLWYAHASHRVGQTPGSTSSYRVSVVSEWDVADGAGPGSRVRPGASASARRAGAASGHKAQQQGRRHQRNNPFPAPDGEGRRAGPASHRHRPATNGFDPAFTLPENAGLSPSVIRLRTVARTALPCGWECMGPGGPHDLQNRWGARHRVPGGIVPLASRQFKLAVSARRARSSPARGRRFDGNADGNCRRGRQSMAANLYPRSPGLGIQWPWTLGLVALGACTRSGRGPTIPRFTPRLTCAGRPPGSSRCCLRGRACPATQAGSCCSTPARSEPANSGGIHRASPTERVGRFGRAGQRDGSAVCLSRALIAAPEPGRRSRSRALPAGRCRLDLDLAGARGGRPSRQQRALHGHLDLRTGPAAALFLDPDWSPQRQPQRVRTDLGPLPRVCCGTPHDLQLLRVPAEVNSHQVVIGSGSTAAPPSHPVQVGASLASGEWRWITTGMGEPSLRRAGVPFPRSSNIGWGILGAAPDWSPFPPPARGSSKVART
jgi:hypothetical protein